MAYINFPKRVYKKREYKYERVNNLNHQAVYNTTKWRELRLTYLKDNPFCEKCSTDEVPVLAKEVHHIYEISNGKTVLEKQRIGFDPNNLMSLCLKCHDDIHKNN